MDNSEARLAVIQKIFDENLGIILMINSDGKVTYLNNTGKTELEYNDIDFKLEDVFVSIFTDGMTIPEFIEKYSAQTIETNVYRSNNTCFSATVRLSRIETDNEKYYVFSILNTQYETTAKQKLDKIGNNMKEAMKERNQFVANITHELRTPLNGIKGHIRDIYNDENDSQKKRKMNIVLKCCENMEKIISNLLDFSKIEAGKFEIEEKAFGFRDAIRHVVDTGISIANEKGLKISAYVAPEIPDTVIGDELRLIQVLNNLVSNALKFTSIGYVNIEVYKTHLKHGRMELTFFVIDTGIGVSPEEKERLFKSFSQADGSITRRFGGTGLGLFVTKQLVELMHGTISLESEVGKGSTFTFTIEVGVESEDIDKQNINSFFANDFETPDTEVLDRIFVYGSVENTRELKNYLEKLLLCIEMGNWEKAEIFSDNIKRLASGAEKSIKNNIFKMQMSVRKEDYDKSMLFLNNVREELFNL